jgi:hypothetical protein
MRERQTQRAHAVGVGQHTRNTLLIETRRGESQRPACELSPKNAKDASAPAIENCPGIRNHTSNRHGIDGYLKKAALFTVFQYCEFVVRTQAEARCAMGGMSDPTLLTQAKAPHRHSLDLILPVTRRINAFHRSMRQDEFR